MKATRDTVNTRHRSTWSTLLFPTGTEPDPRFTLANERTFLANIRTCLAVLAGAIALHAIPAQLIDAHLQRGGSMVLVCISMMGSLLSSIHWLKVERAMRAQAPLPAPVLAPFLALLIVVISVTLAVMLGGWVA